MFFYRSIATTLRSLDLSYNQLTELPVNSLSRTKALDWLNLHGWVTILNAKHGNTSDVCYLFESCLRSSSCISKQS